MKSNKSAIERQKKPMKSRQILAKLALAGLTQVDVATSIGLKRSIVCDVIAGRRTSKRVEKALAKALGTTPVRLFGRRVA